MFLNNGLMEYGSVLGHGAYLGPDYTADYLRRAAKVGNTPTANVIVWSVLSLIALLGGIGLLFAAFGRWRLRSAGTDASRQRSRFARPGDVALTPGAACDAPGSSS